jgi:hypothetical protein
MNDFGVVPALDIITGITFVLCAPYSFYSFLRSLDSKIISASSLSLPEIAILVNSPVLFHYHYYGVRFVVRDVFVSFPFFFPEYVYFTFMNFFYCF